MVFTRFVEVGRVVLINYGPDAGKIATIIDVVDSKRVLIDGPLSINKVSRQVIGLKRISLTDIVVDKLPRGARVNNIEKAWKEQDTLKKWEACSWAKKIDSKKKRSNLTDFDRFKLMITKKQRSKLVADKLAQLK